MNTTLNVEALPGQEMVETYRAECYEQPARLADIFGMYESDEEVRAQIEALKQAVPPELPLLWLGMGASYCSTLSGWAQLARLGRSSFVMEAGEWLHFGAGIHQAVGGPLLVSTSGESAEIIELCRAGGARPSILLCNALDSSCWSAAQIRFPIAAGPERGNATKTYTNSTAACVILASEMAGHGWQREAPAVLRAFAASLEPIFERREELYRFCCGRPMIEVIGRGASLGGATMGALCLREMTPFRAAALPSATFRHGPLLDVDSTHLSIILALGRTAYLGVRLAQDCVARGGRVILVETEEREPAEHLLPFRIAAVPEPWEGLTSVIVPQALALAIMEHTGTAYVRLQTTVQ